MISSINNICCSTLCYQLVRCSVVQTIRLEKLIISLMLTCTICQMGVSQNEAAGTGSLSHGGLFRGSVSWYVSGVCFAQFFYLAQLNSRGLFRGLFRRSVSGYVSGVCFAKVEFPSLILKVALPKKMQTQINIAMKTSSTRENTSLCLLILPGSYVIPMFVYRYHKSHSHIVNNYVLKCQVKVKPIFHHIQHYINREVGNPSCYFFMMFRRSASPLQR